MVLAMCWLFLAFFFLPLTKFIMLLVYLGVIWAYSLCLKISSNASWLLLSISVILELMGCQHVPKPLISRARVFYPGILKLMSAGQRRAPSYLLRCVGKGIDLTSAGVAM